MNGSGIPETVSSVHSSPVISLQLWRQCPVLPMRGRLVGICTRTPKEYLIMSRGYVSGLSFEALLGSIFKV